MSGAIDARYLNHRSRRFHGAFDLFGITVVQQERLAQHLYAFENLQSRKSRHALDLQGLNNAHVTDVRLSNCTFDNVADGSVIKYVDGLRLKDVRVNGKLMTL